jgi:hypothetical protein
MVRYIVNLSSETIGTVITGVRLDSFSEIKQMYPLYLAPGLWH